MRDGMEAQVTLVGSESESQNHKLILVIHITMRLLPESQNHKRLRWGLRVLVVSFLYIWDVGITWYLFAQAWSTNEKEYPQLGTASSVVSHQGLVLSQQLSHQVGACDVWVSLHVTCHLTHHMTSPMIHHMTCTWHIMWLITWPLDLEKESQSTCNAKSRKTKKCSMG
jgi:hypothetical protein